MRAELEGFRLEDEECDEKAGVSKGQAGEPMADERATEKVALQAPVAAERITGRQPRRNEGLLYILLAIGETSSSSAK
jgi:hypothetical protein